MPSSFSRTSTPASRQSTAPATPMAPTPFSNAAPDPALYPAPRPQHSNQLHTCIDWTNKWVINLSKTPLTPKQLSLLQKGPNFAIIPKYPTPIEAYISAVEQASSKLPTHEAEELRSDVIKLLKQQQQSHCNNQCNINAPNAGPSHNLNRTTPGWSSQWTKGWPWSSWTKRITSTKP